MPLIAGVSSNSTQCRILLNPSPFTVALCAIDLWIGLLQGSPLFFSFSHNYPLISSIVLPLFAAISAGVFIEDKPFNVALTTL